MGGWIINNMQYVLRLMQHVRSGGGQALLMGFLASRRPWTQFVATENFKVGYDAADLTQPSSTRLETLF